MSDLFTVRFWKNIGLAALAAFAGSFGTALAALEEPIGVDVVIGLATAAAWAAVRLVAGLVAAKAGSDFDK